MKYGSLFSGVGALDLAIEAVFGAKPAWQCENEPSACAVLGRHWPGVPNLGDVAAVRWADVEPVDIMCGGFPCTDLSAAGKRAGLNPETRSGLWEHFATAISVLRPRLVVIENVRGITSASATHPAHDLGLCSGCLGIEPGRVVLRALGAVLGDLADLGFDAEWLGVPASDVGAAHPRFRIFIIAWPAADTKGDGWNKGRAEPAGIVGGSDASFGGSTADPNPVRERHQGRPEAGSAGQPRADARTKDAGGLDLGSRWGDYGPAIERWESVVGRMAPDPTIVGQNGQPKLSPDFVEWLMGLPEGWVTGGGITVNESLARLGNGVVPQQAEWAIRELLRRIEGE